MRDSGKNYNKTKTNINTYDDDIKVFSFKDNNKLSKCIGLEYTIMNFIISKLIKLN